jgi:hypothetical protein
LSGKTGNWEVRMVQLQVSVVNIAMVRIVISLSSHHTSLLHGLCHEEQNSLHTHL